MLKRETKNKNDDKAILILTEDGQKLGYVPKEKNEVLSNLMDAGKLLFGRLDKKTWVDTWLKLDIQVFLRDLFKCEKVFPILVILRQNPRVFNMV